jgi:beta-lactamase regulating signal transducer with metallopeptidase domain
MNQHALAGLASFDYSSLLVRELGRVGLLVSLAALIVTLLLRAVRSTSPKIHRAAWCAVLLQGWLIVRLPVAVPWYEQVSPATEIGNAMEENLESLSVPGRGQGEGDHLSLSLDGRGQGQGENEPASAARQPMPLDAPNPRPSPKPSLASEGNLDELSPSARGQGEVDHISLSLDGRSQAEGDPQPLSLPARSQAEGDFQLLSLPGRGQGEGENGEANISRFAPAIAAVWLAGIVGCVALWLFGYVRFLQRLPVGQPADAAWLDQWRELLTQHGVRRPIPLRVTGDLGPLLCRRLRGYELLVPAGLWRDLSQSQRAAILRHELAHYHRADVWKSLAARVLALPQWFNPLAWLAVRRFDEAAEWACDQAATAGQPQTTDYARALVRLGEAATRQASYRPAAHGQTLAVRVRRLLSSGNQEDSIMKKTLLIAAAAALVAVGLVRLELVAREPKIDDSIVTDADTSPGRGTRAKETLGLLALATKATQEAQAQAAKGDYRAAAEAAGKAFEATQAAYETDTVPLSDLCSASLRLLDAQRKASQSRKEDVAAVEAYLARTQTIHDKVKALFNNGAHGGEAEKYYSMVYYLEDAKGMLKAARERGAKSSDAGQNKEANQLSVFSLQNAKAADVIPILQAAMNASQGAEHLKDVRMAPDPRTNSLVVSAPPEVMKVLTALLQRLDETPSAAPPANAAGPTSAQAKPIDHTAADRKAAIEQKLAEDRRLRDMKDYLDSLASKRVRETIKGVERAIENRKAQIEQELGATIHDAKTPAPTASSNQKAPDTNASHRRALIDRKLAEDRRLQDMKDYYDSLELEAVDEEKRLKGPNAGKRLRESMKGVAEQIERRKAQIEQELSDDFARADKAERERLAHIGKDPRSLRFDGKTFDQWREELLTELKPERRTEAIHAFRAFAANGLGRDAAQAIVDLMRGYDVWMIDPSSPEGILKQTAIDALATIDHADAVPVLRNALKEGNANQRQFAARVFLAYVPGEKDAAPVLISAVGDEDTRVRMVAIESLAHIAPRPAEAVPALRKALKDKNRDVVIAAIRALVPPPPAGHGGEAFVGMRPEAIFVPEFLDLLQDDDDHVRERTHFAVLALGPKCKPALPAALAWLRGNNQKQRLAACTMIFNIGPKAKEAVPDLIKIVDDPKRDGEETMSAIEALGGIGPAANEAIPAIEKAVERLRPKFGKDLEWQRAQRALDNIRQSAENPKEKETPDPNAQSSGKDRLQRQRYSALIQVKADSNVLAPGRRDVVAANAFRVAQIALLKSDRVLRQALTEPGIAQLAIVKAQADPVRWLQKNLQAQYEADSDKLRVQLAAGPADEAAKIVNAVVKAYFDEIVNESSRRRKAELAKLQRAYNEREARVADLRKRKGDRAKALGIAENGQNVQVRLLLDEVAALRNAVTTLGAQAVTAELEVFDLETKLKIETDPAKREAYLQKKLAEDGDLKDMKKRLADTEAALSKEASKAKDDPNAGKQTKDAIRELQEKIEKRKAAIVAEFSASTLDVKAAELRGQLDVAKKKSHFYNEKFRVTKDNLDKRVKNLNEIKVASVEIDDMNEALKQQEALRATLFQVLERKKIEADTPPRVKLLEEAQPPAAKN